MSKESLEGRLEQVPEAGYFEKMNKLADLPALRTIGEYDMLIRSASTLLSIITPQLAASSDLKVDDPMYRLVSRMDRVATLMVSRDKADVSAVVHKRSSVGTTLVGISNENQIEGIFSVKNSTGKSPGPSGCPPIFKPISAGDKVGKDWLLKCLAKGPMGPVAHAKQIEFFCNAFINAEDDAAKMEIKTQMKCFTYFQCYPKIQQRFRITMHARSNKKFLEIFTAGCIDEARLSKAVESMPKVVHINELQQYDFSPANIIGSPHQAKDPSLYTEEKLAKQASDKTGYKFRLDKFQHLIFDETSILHFHQYVCSLMVDLDSSFRELALHRAVEVATGNQKEKRQVLLKNAEKARNNLDECTSLLKRVSTLVVRLGNMANRTYAFRRYLANSAVNEAIAKLMQDPEMVPEDIPEDLRNVLLDEGSLNDLPPTSLPNTIGAVIKWIALLTQWSEGLQELPKAVGPEFRFEVVDLPPTVASAEQASLTDLFDFAIPGFALKKTEIFKRLNFLANRKLMEDGPANIEWGKFTTARVLQWKNTFSGKHHCETSLGSLISTNFDDVKAHVKGGEAKRDEFKKLLEALQGCEPVIGVSKKCCYLCNQFLEILYKDRIMHHKGTTGKIFPWAWPEWEIRIEIARVMAEKLGDLVRTELAKHGVLNPLRRHSASECGQTESLSDGSLE